MTSVLENAYLNSSFLLHSQGFIVKLIVTPANNITEKQIQHRIWFVGFVQGKTERKASNKIPFTFLATQQEKQRKASVKEHKTEKENTLHEHLIKIKHRRVFFLSCVKKTGPYESMLAYIL